MDPRLDFLGSVPFHRIAAAFNTAFSDYYLRMGSQAEVWLKNRLTKNAVDLDCSVGVFAGDDLVGFSLTGIDAWMGETAAFDAATGIVPDYRGQGLAGRMFEFGLPRLRERGVRRFLLEVLQVNEPAIAAYKKTGFKIVREFDCFELAPEAGIRTPGLPQMHIPTGSTGKMVIRPVPKQRLEELAEHLDWQPSWENSLASIRRIPDDVVAFGAETDGRLDGIILYYPLLHWIVSLVVRRDRRRRGIGSRLVSHLIAHLPDESGQLKVVNVPHTDRGMISFLERAKFRLFVSQYEMEMMIAMK
jgi:ribosomal protein S18 acetylase RimI-like enzyme